MSRRRRRYVQMSHLHGHSDGITTVVFSPLGNYLATGGLDGKLCIWDVEDGRLLHRHIGNSAVSSICWIPGGETELLFGTKAGNIARLIISTTSLTVSGFCAHKYPVERLAVKDSSFASGALSELKIWSWDVDAELYVCKTSIPDPPKLSKNVHKEVIVTSLHWTHTEQDGPLLLVTYMHHGVYLYAAAKNWRHVRTITPGGKIGDASLSPDGKHLAISNLDSGFDVYRMADSIPVCSFVHEAPEPDIVPVRFIHGGNAFVGGSSVGRLGVWDVYLKQKLFALQIPKGAPVRAIDGHCKLADDRSEDRFFIATGVFNLEKNSPCIIWQARDIGEAAEEEQPEEVAPAEVTHAERRAISSWRTLGTFLTNLLVTAICTVILAYVFELSRDGTFGNRFFEKSRI